MNPCPEIRRLQAEHARWLEALGREGKEGRGARLLALWAEEIGPHCRREEEVLLPELAGHLSEADAVIVFTLGDHVELRRLVRRVREAPVADLEWVEAFERKLVEHLAFEERTLFPVLQETLGCAVLAALSSEIAPARHD
jgi:iron-sulfur cluster repair protein YtfE (RIC family)